MKKSLGFTLIELLVTMTIIAMLLAISLISYQGARKSSRDGKRKADLEQIRSALEMYRTDVHRYPDALGTEIKTETQSYLTTVPSDPLSDRKYSYAVTTNTNGYNLCAALEVGGGIVTNCGSCTIDCNYKVTNP